MSDKDKKPKFSTNVKTGMFNMNYMKIYVVLHLSRKMDKNNNTVGMVEKYVTSIEWSPKVFHYEDNKPAHEFNSIGEALDFCVAVGVNGYSASVVLAADWNDKNIYMNYPEESKNELSENDKETTN